MTDITFFERIKILFSLIFSSSFFISILVIFLLTTVVLIIYNKVKTKKLKYIIAIGYFLIAVLVLIKYGPSILKLSDSLVDQIFAFLYFPNIISYICMILATTLLLISTLINDKLNPFIKTCNIISFASIEILFVLILDVIVKNNVDIYNKTQIYSNETLMVLIQASTGLFLLWLLILFIDFIVESINKKIEINNTNIEVNINEVLEEPNKKIDFIFEDPIVLTDEQFSKVYVNSENNKHKEFINYFNNK